MAQKRMFSLSVVDTDKFLEMPISSRLLYYELGMRADDDGFIGNWKKILLFTGLKEDDLKILISKNFLIPFESGVIVIKHWRMNNYLQNDRTKPTVYQSELKQLSLENNNVYTLDTSRIHSIDKYSIDKYSIEEYSSQDNKQNVYQVAPKVEVKNSKDDNDDIYKFLEKLNWVVNGTPIEINTIRFWEEQNVDRKLLKEAILETQRRNISNINYVHEILKNLTKKQARKNQSDVPSWFGKKIEKVESSQQEIEEMQELLKEFK